MLLLVGLGNPEPKYAGNRHNVGFMAVDAIAAAHGFDAPKAKFHGALREGAVDAPSGRTRALILKPLTYYNESGRSVAEAVRFYKIAPEDVIVFHDELDLAPGKVRAKTGGGNAGNNGLRSIESQIGNGFRRVRIGIGHPGDKARVTGWVLGDFPKAQHDDLAALLDAIARSAPLLTGDDGDSKFASEVGRLLAPSPASAKAPAPAAQDRKTAGAPSGTGVEPKKHGALAEGLKRLLGKHD